ncbi:MAG: lysophospholipid acyltransferase family protein [Elusimicrobiota bacterium]|jgi:predicted LPLAT superfamily acyltransferase|nr:lysophospholipid acyltransferase family protein [Elusimicrobiota bacterium]
MAQKWTSKSRSKVFFHKLLIFFIKAGAANLCYFSLYFIVAFYLLLPSIRKNSAHYLNRRFPSDGRIKRFFRTYRLNLTFGKILMDRAVFGLIGKTKIVPTLDEKNKFFELYSKNNALIVLTAHCGCWQIAMSAFDFIEGDKFVVYHRDRDDIDKHIHELAGRAAPVQFIDPSDMFGGGIEVMARLSKGAVVSMMGDRTFGSKNSGVLVNFLGGRVELPFSVYRIAGALNVPIAVVFFPYGGKGKKIDFFVSDVFFVKDKGRLKDSYIEDAQKFADCLEDFVAKYPYQFYNYFNMWEEKND